ncbi:peroxisome biogenesis 3-2-like [Olea europaea subsp. europaea]|nr:peroxisome biogenesis 3-2-like [Olea europaea subsp. europaea]
MQSHFESIQRIADSTTFPHVMEYLESQVAENLDLAHFTERLIQGKGQPNTLTTAEKLELWDRLKILSFTRMVLSLWTMSMLSLYVRVQVNILGRHLYIGTARDLGSSPQLDEADLIDRNDEQQFLAYADYLSNFGLPTLISDTEAATSQVLKGKLLKDFFTATILDETIVQILDTFMSMGSPHHWVGYLMPEDSGVYNLVSQSSSSGYSDLPHATKLEQLMGETRAVLLSVEFGNIIEMSLKTLVNELMKDISSQCGESTLLSGMPLAKLLPRIAQIGQQLLKEPYRSRYVQNICSIPEVEQFFTLLYSSTPFL